MTPKPTSARIVRDRARQSGVELPPQAIVELAEHLDDLYDAARAGGATDADAHAAAMRALDESSLGDLTTAARLRARPPVLPALALHARHPLRSTNMFQAFRLALRQFSHQRTFAVVTVLILGLGIGAAVTVYTIVDSVVLRPLPYREPDRLVMMWETNHEKGLRHELLSPVNFMDYRTMTSFTDSAGWWRPTVNIAEPGSEPVRVSTIETSANLFDLLGVVPQLGAGFPKEPFYSPDLIAVISDRLWRTRYNADPSIVGKQLQFNNVNYTITGVMAPGFHFPDNVDVWWRVQWDYRRHSRAAHFMEAIGRLAPGRTIDQASDELKTLTARLGEQFAATNRAWSVRLVSVLDEQLGYYRPALAVLFGAVALLCAIGCLNVASLLLTRSLSREREMAVRTAMGATPRHMIVQLLAEGAVLSIGGALAGVAAAFAALPLIVAATPVEIPRLAEASINLRVLGFAVIVAILTTMIFGLVPALVLMKRNLAPDLRSGERGSSRGSRTIYHGLVAGEVALACALLVSSGLLVRSVGRMMDVPTGVGNGAALSASVQLTAAVPNWPDMPAKYGAILDQIRRTPGVRNAGATNALPLELGWRMPFAIEGAAPVRAEDAPQAQYQSVTEGYFEAIGARLVDGRFFTSRDDASMPGALVVNEAFAKKFFGDGRAVGKYILLASRGVGPLGRNLLGLPPPGAAPAAAGGGRGAGAAPATPPPPPPPIRYEIVGVVADVRNAPLGQVVEAGAYTSARQFPFGAMFITVDAQDSTSAVTAIRSALKAVVPTVPLSDPKTWDQRIRARSGEPRLLMSVLIFFSALAGVLAALGVYGLFSWSVALRRRELAIRLTLGAQPRRIGVAVLRQAAILTVVGLAAGLAIVQLANSTLARVLFDTSPRDAASAATAIAVLFVASIAACALPAWRATRVNPVDGLRNE